MTPIISSILLNLLFLSLSLHLSISFPTLSAIEFGHTREFSEVICHSSYQYDKSILSVAAVKNVYPIYKKPDHLSFYLCETTFLAVTYAFYTVSMVQTHTSTFE